MLKSNNHPFGLRFQYEIFDKGRVIKRYGGIKHQKAFINIRIHNPGKKSVSINFPFGSYVSNYLRILQYAFLAIDNSTSGDAPNKALKTNAGGATYPAAAIHTMAVNEGQLTSPTQTNFGIWIGDTSDYSGLGIALESGISGAVQFDDYRLRGLILADGGSPDTDVEYRATSVALSNSDQTLTVTRRFQNNSGNTVYINEIGLIGKSGTDYVLLCRDRLPLNAGESSVYELLTTGVVEVSYIFTIDNASGWTKNFLRYLSSEFVAGNALSQVKDLGNTAQTINFSSARTQKDMLAANDNDAYGIQIGGIYNPTDEPLDQALYTIGYKIDNKLTQAQIDHSVVTSIALEQTEGVTKFGLYRDFENTGSVNIIIDRSGIVIRQGTSPYTYYLFAHDAIPLVSQYLTLTPGQILRVKYFFEGAL